MLDNMHPRLVAAMVIAVLLGGVGWFFLIIKASESIRTDCFEQCRAIGKTFIAAPAGTVSHSIEGGGQRSMGVGDAAHPNTACTCVTK